MRTAVGIFTSRAEAERAARELRASGIAPDNINLLTQGASEEAPAAVSPTEARQVGTGETIGTVVGGAVGLAGGVSLGAAAANLAIPGAGPIIGIGLVAGAIMGMIGGARVGEVIDDSLATEAPRDELSAYQVALRQGRSVLIVLAETAAQAEAARQALAQAGAEQFDTTQ